MKTESGSTGLKPEKTPYGKVIGVVENRDQLQAVSEALSKLGVQDVAVLDGAAGVQLLDREQDDAAHCFLGDMEEEMVHRYLDAVKQGAIVFAAVATFIILKVLDVTMGLRVSQQDEVQGLDYSQHGEEGYIFI